MQNNYYTRIDNRLVEDFDEPSPEDLCYKDYDGKASYPINPADDDKFKEGVRFEEGKDFEVWDAKEARLLSDFLGIDHKTLPLNGKIAIFKK